MQIIIAITSNNKCKCESWLNHWEKHSKLIAEYCAEKTCINKDLIGVHVQKTTSDMNWYIIPLCNSHFKSKGELEISDIFPFVSANVKETCDK
jgi:hypothetical protein